MMISYNSTEIEELRALISWLLELAEQGKKWHSWLDAQVKILQRILNFLTGEYFAQLETGVAKNITRENELVKTMEEIVPDGDEEKSPQLHGEINRAQDDEKRASSSTGVIMNEILNGELDKSRHWTDQEHSSEVSGTWEAIDKIPWPIGVPWVPQVFDKNKKKESKLKKLELVKHKTPLTKNEEKMINLMNQMKTEATNYRQVYKRWQKILKCENKLT